MKLIDSSSWIHALRKDGDPEVRKRVTHLLVEAEAAWCDLVRVELWMGVRHQKEEAFLKELERNIEIFPMSATAWDTACGLGRRLRAAGRPVPTTDLLIFSCAMAHRVEVEHSDRHFDVLENEVRRNTGDSET